MSHSSGTVVYSCSDKLALLYALFLHCLFILFLLSFSHHSLTHSLHFFLSPILILSLSSLIPTPLHFFLYSQSQSFYLLPSIVRLSAVPTDQLKDAVDSLAQTIASLKEKVKKICPHSPYHYAPPPTPLLSQLPLSLLSPSSSTSFFSSVLSTSSLLFSSFSSTFPSFYCPFPSCSKFSLSTTNSSSSLFFLFLHNIYFTLPSLSCLLSNRRPVQTRRDSVPVWSCYWQFRGY